MCGTLMDNPARFNEHFLEDFVKLGADRVSNVRILIAKVLHEKYTKNSKNLLSSEGVNHILDEY